MTMKIGKVKQKYFRDFCSAVKCRTEFLENNLGEYYRGQAKWS